MPVRRLNNFVYCPRLFYFQWVENIFQESADTVAGSLTHRNVDAASRLDEDRAKALADALPEGARLRSLRLESEALGLVGVVDLIEGGPDGAQIVDYKNGSARRNSEGERKAREPESAQVAAYALMLREQGVNVSSAVIYYAKEKRRVAVELSEELFAATRKAITEAKALAASGVCPPPLKNDPRCLGCSAYPICLPNESIWWAKARREASPIRNFALPSRRWMATSCAIRFCKRSISRPSRGAIRPRPWKRQDRLAMRAKCWWCRLLGHRSASAESKSW